MVTALAPSVSLLISGLLPWLSQPAGSEQQHTTEDAPLDDETDFSVFDDPPRPPPSPALVEELPTPGTYVRIDFARTVLKYLDFEFGPDYIVIPLDSFLLAGGPSSGKVEAWELSPRRILFTVHYHMLVRDFMPKPDSTGPQGLAWKNGQTLSFGKQPGLADVVDS